MDRTGQYSDNQINSFGTAHSGLSTGLFTSVRLEELGSRTKPSPMSTPSRGLGGCTVGALKDLS